MNEIEYLNIIYQLNFLKINKYKLYIENDRMIFYNKLFDILIIKYVYFNISICH